jgi:hypothetical protein
LWILGLPCVVSARNGQTTWENLKTVQPGQKIQVVETNSKKDSGTFVSVSDTDIRLQSDAGENTVQRNNVRSVKLMKQSNRLRNSLIAGAVGAGVGAGVGAAAYKGCSPSQAFCIQPIGRGGLAGIGAAVGFVGGAVVGALLPGAKTIYHAAGQ